MGEYTEKAAANVSQRPCLEPVFTTVYCSVWYSMRWKIEQLNDKLLVLIDLIGVGAVAQMNVLLLDGQQADL